MELQLSLGHSLIFLRLWIISIRLRTPVDAGVQNLAVGDEDSSGNNGIVCTLDALISKCRLHVIGDVIRLIRGMIIKIILQ